MRENPHLSSTLEALFPAGVIVAEMRSLGSVADLMLAEREHLGAAVPKRIGEFAAGRLCARRALSELGVVGVPIRVAQDRQPIWPSSIVGSITHTTGFCAAAVAEKRVMRAVGIDSEGVGRVTADIWDTICTPPELAWVDALHESERHAAITLMFSAKEAFYKCQYPVVGEWLDFEDLRVEIPNWKTTSSAFMVSATRSISISKHAALPAVGQYVFHDGFVTAGIAFPARS